MYVNCGILDCGHKLFDETPKEDMISTTRLIVTNTKSGEKEYASVLVWFLWHESLIVPLDENKC